MLRCAAKQRQRAKTTIRIRCIRGCMRPLPMFESSITDTTITTVTLQSPRPNKYGLSQPQVAQETLGQAV